MQMFWMDTDPSKVVGGVARACASSKYSLAELEAIFWNEVRPAVSFNKWSLPAPEWAGFELERLKSRVLAKHRFGAALPWKLLHPYSDIWWHRLRHAVSVVRGAS